LNALLVLPIVVPLLTAAGCLLAWRSRRAQRNLGTAGALAQTAVATALLIVVWEDGIRATQLGDWPAPFGITMVADTFSAIMVFMGALIGLAVTFYSLSSMDVRREAFGYYPLMHILLMGVSGAFLTGDIFNLFVWFEVMLIASFVMMALGSERAQMEAAIKYVTINLFSSAIFLTGVGILYGMAGSLNMADLSLRLEDASPGLVTTVGVLFMASFGIKAAVFPLFFWLPASYHTPPIAVTALFAGLLTKVGVYALIRVFTLLFVRDVPYTHEIILIIAGLTMVTGVLGAVAQDDVRRILSFHIISQIGYMIMGLGLFTPLALTGSIFYIIHHIIVKTNLFLVAGIAQRLGGSYRLKQMGGLYRAYPALAVFFMIPAMSLAGIPPLSGFFAKLALVQAGLDIERYLIVAAALAVGALTLFSMTKIWAEAFWKPAPEAMANEGSRDHMPVSLLLFAPVILLAAMTVGIGLAAEPVFALSKRAASELLDPAQYVDAVLGEGGRGR
jgi:multicomponent Na+:H+ antiporter subunit D